MSWTLPPTVSEINKSQPSDQKSNITRQRCVMPDMVRKHETVPLAVKFSVNIRFSRSMTPSLAFMSRPSFKAPLFAADDEAVKPFT